MKNDPQFIEKGVIKRKESKTIFYLKLGAYVCAFITISLGAIYKFLTWDRAASEHRWKLHR